MDFNERKLLLGFWEFIWWIIKLGNIFNVVRSKRNIFKRVWIDNDCNRKVLVGRIWFVYLSFELNRYIKIIKLEFNNYWR